MAPYQKGLAELEKVKNQLDELEAHNFITPSTP